VVVVKRGQVQTTINHASVSVGLFASTSPDPASLLLLARGRKELAADSPADRGLRARRKRARERVAVHSAACRDLGEVECGQAL
jgi:hypothetical protein